MKNSFAAASAKCHPHLYGFMALQQSPLRNGFSVYCTRDMWFDPEEIADNDEECMDHHDNGQWLGGNNRAAVYYL